MALFPVDILHARHLGLADAAYAPYIENDKPISRTIEMSGRHDIRLTQTTLRVLQAFTADVSRELSGADIWEMTKIGSGSRYPILIRLEDAGWLTSRWEDLDPSEAKRPRRRYYRLTGNGQAWARSALDERGFGEGLAWTF